MGYVDDRRKPRRETGKKIDQPQSARHRDCRKARSCRGVADRVERSSYDTAMEKHPEPCYRQNQNHGLGGYDTTQITLAKIQKPAWKAGIVSRPCGYTFSQAAKQRVRS